MNLRRQSHWSSRIVRTTVGRHAPEEHPGLWRVPLREAGEMALQGALKHVASGAVEVCDRGGVSLEAFVAPCSE